LVAQEQALRDFDRAARRTRLHLMAERRRAATRTRSAVAYLDLIIGASLLIPLGLVVVVSSILMLAGVERYDPLIWLVWAIFGVGVAVLRAVRRRAARRKLAISDALDRLAAGLDARRLPGFDDAVAWMNRYWPASHEQNDLFRGAAQGALAGTLRGYPVLVDVEPDGYASDDSNIDPRVLLYVAALAPASPPAGDDEVASLSAAIRTAGFEPELLPDAGWRARADEPTVTRLRRAPAGLADLAPVVRDLVRLAEACGAAPAPAA
jgi:hypothetical protein